MNKQEFIESLAEQCDFSKADAGRAVDAILGSLTEVMADGEEVRFTGFGTFLSQRRRAREGVNPQDPSQKIRIRAAHVPKFKPGTSLREAASQAPVDTAAQSASRAGTAPGAGDARASSADEPGAWVPLSGRD